MRYCRCAETRKSSRRRTTTPISSTTTTTPNNAHHHMSHDTLKHLPREEGLSTEKLREDAPDAPQVYRVAVQAVGAKHQLGGAVPPCHSRLGHGVVHLRSNNQETVCRGHQTPVVGLAKVVVTPHAATLGRWCKLSGRLGVSRSSRGGGACRLFQPSGGRAVHVRERMLSQRAQQHRCAPAIRDFYLKGNAEALAFVDLNP